jgi:hypothetical protein
MFVHFNNGGDLHGHLTLTVTALRYADIAGAANVFVPPIDPPNNPIIPTAPTGAQIAEAVCPHQE